MAKISPLMTLPVIAFVGMATLFAVGMGNERTPGELPSAFIGQTVPDLKENPLDGYASFDSDALKDGEVKIVNFFASWCPPCRAEHPALMALANEGIPIYGINKNDKTDDAVAFLEELGNPYAGIIADLNGRQSINWGVAALPETFVIARDGTVVFKFAGPIHREIDTLIRPALAEAAAR